MLNKLWLMSFIVPVADADNRQNTRIDAGFLVRFQAKAPEAKDPIVKSGYKCQVVLH